MNIKNNTFIIAEIGNNHEGSFQTAVKLINSAHKCGVDAVKFQTFKTEKFISSSNIENFNKYKNFELSHDEFYKLSIIAKKKRLKFISTPFDLESAEFLNNIVDAFKIASGDNNYFELIKKVIGFKKETLISTGLLDKNGLNRLYNFIKNKKFNLNKLTLMHCVSGYPVPDKYANLRNISLIKNNYKCRPGYSDHTKGIYAGVAAVSLGAKVIEKHFTIDNNFSKFRDHKMALNPKDMKDFVKSIRIADLMLGKENKKIQKCEEGILKYARRNYYFNKEIKIGNKINKKDLDYVRPAKHLKKININFLINKKTKKRIKKNQIIKPEQFI